MTAQTKYEKFIHMLREFAEITTHIESVIIVGSYARGTNKEDSDLDIVIITSNQSEMVAHQDFVLNFGEVIKKQTEYYGACTYVRVWYKNHIVNNHGYDCIYWIIRL